MKYLVKIKENMEKTVEVEAESAEEAKSIVEGQYNREEIVLDYMDWEGTDYEVYEVKE